jgi:hypothetical protein
MPTFVQILNFTSVTGMFNEAKDTQKVNKTLEHLQSKGARILDIKSTIAFQEATEHSTAPVAAIHTVTILYEAPQPIQ